MSPSMHRARAREALRGNWPTAVLVTLVASLLGGLDYSGPKLNINLETIKNPATIFLPISPASTRTLTNMIGVSLISLISICAVAAIVSLILGGAIHVGYCRYQLNLHDGKDSSFSDLFSYMDHFGNALCMQVLRSLAIALGTLCLVFPGIILAYGFSMAGYIMAEDPDCGAVEALKRSWHLMDEHKMDLFILELTFIGWEFLALFTAGIGFFFLNPYTEAASASFYRELKPQSRYTTFR